MLGAKYDYNQGFISYIKISKTVRNESSISARIISQSSRLNIILWGLDFDIFIHSDY